MAEQRHRGRFPASYTWLSSEQLWQALRERSVGEAEIDRALAAVSGPDPAGALSPPRREEVAHIAVYLHQRRGRAWIQSPFWRLIEQGHPAARAVYWHELQEMESYRLMGVRNPLRVRSGTSAYWQAHARASWLEAQYWAAWAAAEGQQIPLEAFLRAQSAQDSRRDQGDSRCAGRAGVPCTFLRRVLASKRGCGGSPQRDTSSLWRAVGLGCSRPTG